MYTIFVWSFMCTTCVSFQKVIEQNQFQFWKLLCKAEDLTRYEFLLSDDVDGPKDLVGFNRTPLRIFFSEEMPDHMKMFKRGLHMRKNILKSNFRGWRIFANENVPIEPIDGSTDLSELKKSMGVFPKLSANDDIKVDWNEKYLVMFHFFRSALQAR